MKSIIHKPVLVDEVIKALKLEEVAHLKSQSSYIDATVGAGGHAVEIVKRDGFVLGIDADEEMLGVAQEKLRKACPATFGLHESGRFKLVHDNFRNIDKVANDNSLDEVDGIIFDLGTSYLQLTSRRGMSFTDVGAELDMRLDKERQGVTAADLLNGLPRLKLEEMFLVTVNPGLAKYLAREVVKQRSKKVFRSVGDYLDLVDKVSFLNKTKPKKIHPATLPFLALRIAVNSELENLKEALPKAFGVLKSGGRLVVISFHSGEDRIVKDYFRKAAEGELSKIINKKPIIPTKDEISKNLSARSAKMRVLEKI